MEVEPTSLVPSKTDPKDMTRFRTPKWLWNFLNEKYKFTLDAAAEAINALLPHFIDKAMDAFKAAWSGRVYINPPYGDKEGPSTEDWIQLAYERSKVCDLVCALIPNKPDTNVYHDYIRMGDLVSEDKFIDTRGKEGIHQVRATPHCFIETWEFRQRISFDTDAGEGQGTGRFASVAVVFRRRK